MYNVIKALYGNNVKLLSMISSITSVTENTYTNIIFILSILIIFHMIVGRLVDKSMARNVIALRLHSMPSK